MSMKNYEKVKNYKYLGSLFTNENYFQEEIKAKKSCYYSDQTILSSRFLKIFKLKCIKQYYQLCYMAVKYPKADF